MKQIPKLFKHIKHNFSATSRDTQLIVYNIIGSFGVRGGSLVVSLLTLPVYTHFFQNQKVLGVWFTLLSVLNWVLTFDLGLGNGLRNKLPFALAQRDRRLAREYISSTYFGTLGVALIMLVIGILLIPSISWVNFINVHGVGVTNAVMTRCIVIIFAGILLQFVMKLVTSILFAIQESAIVNFLSLVVSASTLIMVVMAKSGSVQQNLTTMAVINVISANVPYLIATLYIFATRLKGLHPSLRFVTSKRVREVLNIGITLLVLQVVFMVISSTNEILISHLTSPKDVVDYQAYNKIFNTISSLFALALTPIWSAVTKAGAEKKYRWILKLNHRILASTVIVFALELFTVPVLQTVVNLWLGKGYIVVTPYISILFVLTNTVMYLHNVNTSFGNGLSFFKIQFIWMIFAAIVDIPLAFLFVNLFNGWIGVVFANFVALLPYEIIEILAFDKYVISLERIEENK